MNVIACGTCGLVQQLGDVPRAIWRNARDAMEFFNVTNKIKSNNFL